MSQNGSNRLSRLAFSANKQSPGNYRLFAIALLLFAFGAIAYASSLTAFTADSPAGWIINGSDLPNYEISIDTTVKHAGKASARIKFIAGKAGAFGGLMQMFKADDYHGKRVRMSASVNT